MRAVVTRVLNASVEIGGQIVGSIGEGFLILLGIAPEDTPSLCTKLADKILGLRVLRLTRRAEQEEGVNATCNHVLYQTDRTLAVQLIVPLQGRNHRRNNTFQFFHNVLSF